MAKKKKKYSAPKDEKINLSVEEIEMVMEELREQEEYQSLTEAELQVKAIQVLFSDFEGE